jgi:hypothetical protein
MYYAKFIRLSALLYGSRAVRFRGTFSPALCFVAVIVIVRPTRQPAESRFKIFVRNCFFIYV